MMTAETNKATIRRIVEEIQNGDNLALIDELAAPTFVNHTPAPGLSPDREGIKQLLSMFRAAFPDGVMTIEDMIAEGDKVVSRKTYRGTHQGEFLGIPPTGRQVSVGLIDIMRLVDGQVVEHWSVGDDLGMLQQLGVLPPL
jgi:predicted ester cyclase